MKSLFEIIGHILLAFFALSEDDKKWILDYLCTKGVFPYDEIESYEDLDCVPAGEFFRITEFYSLLKNEIMKRDKYENVKTFWQKKLACNMHMKKLLDLNGIYNFQDMNDE